jgi:dihydroxyacetone kinase
MVFAGPPVNSCAKAIHAADGGSGAPRLYGNYDGDRMNFELAGEMVEMDGMALRPRPCRHGRYRVGCAGGERRAAGRRGHRLRL